MLVLGLAAAALVPALVGSEGVAARAALGFAVLLLLGAALALHLGSRGAHLADPPGPVAEAAEHEHVREVEHRLQNLLATVTAVLHQSRRSQRDPADAIADFERRLADLRRLHTCLAEEGGGGGGPGPSLARLVTLATEPYAATTPGAEPRVALRGPDLGVPPAMVLPLGTALCELATNAVKYGALSTDAGHVDVEWDLAPATPGVGGATHTLVLSWTERDGPRVEPPSHRGYGSSLLERGLPTALGGEAQLDFAPNGLSCCLSIPFTPEPVTRGSSGDDVLAERVLEPHAPLAAPVRHSGIAPVRELLP